MKHGNQNGKKITKRLGERSDFLVDKKNIGTIILPHLNEME
jgi:hypothetical protein